MTIDDRARLSMYQRLEHVLGPEDAGTLMAHLPPAGWGDLATKGDLALTASGLRSEMDSLRGEMGSLRGEMGSLRTQMALLGTELRSEMALLGTELRSEMALLGTELRSEMESLRSEVRSDLAALRAEMYRSQRQLAITLVGIMGVMNSALVAVVAALR